MRRQGSKKIILSAVYNFLFFFLVVSFIVTCCMLLFLRLLTDSLGVVLSAENIGLAAKITLLNVIIISLLLSTIDILRRHFFVDRPTKKIVDATKRVIEGDFDAHIENYASLLVSDNINEIIDGFNVMTEELRGVETLRTDFVSSVSHEMKTPLAVIQNYGKLLETPGLDEERRQEYARGIVNNTARLSDMVTNILKLTKLENQEIYPRCERYNLGEQLCECLLMYESDWEERGIEIETDIEEDVFVSADKELLSIVWNNLLSNAFKFTASGGSVSLSLARSGDCVAVSVKDTGCGMSAEVGERIFEKFYQGDSSRATRGNGLGLALVKRVVDILRGEISVESRVGEGTTFTVKFWGY